MTESDIFIQYEMEVLLFWTRMPDERLSKTYAT